MNYSEKIFICHGYLRLNMHLCISCSCEVTKYSKIQTEVITIMGNTTAAAEALITHSSTKQVSCTRVKMWTFHSGT